jgi:hypothetical protein
MAVRAGQAHLPAQLEARRTSVLIIDDAQLEALWRKLD